MSSLLKDGYFSSRPDLLQGGRILSNILFFPVIEMISDPTSVISIFFDTSLKSWVLKLVVLPGRSMYTNISGVEQIQFIIKLCIVTPPITTRDGVVVPIYKKMQDYYSINGNPTPYPKSSETADSIFSESKIQQDVSLDSILGGSNEVSPPVTSFVIFDVPQSAEFLSILKNKALLQGSRDLIHTIDYLRPIIMHGDMHGGYKLGVIVMPMVLNSIPVSQIQISDDKLRIETTTSVVRLVVIDKAFPFDLHTNNRLYVTDPTNPLNNRVVLIDFGRTSGLRPDDDDNSYIDKQDRITLYELITSNYELRLNRLSRSFESNKNNAAATAAMEGEICQYMKEVLEWIKNVEIQCNQKREQMLHGGHLDPDKAYKMKFIDIILNTPDERARCGLLMESFKNLSDSIKVTNPAINKRAIDAVIREGRIIGFHDVGARDFECSRIPDRIGSFTINKIEPPQQLGTQTNPRAASASSSDDSRTASYADSRTASYSRTAADSYTTSYSPYFNSSSGPKEAPGGGALKQSRRKQSRRKQSRRKQSRRKQRAKYSNSKKAKRRRMKK